MSEVLVNNAQNVLANEIDSDTTAIVLVNASGFPVSGTYRIAIDKELMLVAGRSGNTLTVTRGIESTSAVYHPTLSKVAAVLTAAGLLAVIRQEIG